MISTLSKFQKLFLWIAGGSALGSCILFFIDLDIPDQVTGSLRWLGICSLILFALPKKSLTLWIFVCMFLGA